LIDDAKSVDPSWLVGVKTIGITAGASAPEELVTELLDYLRSLAEIELELVAGVEENIQFKLPTELINAVPNNKEIRA
jgi:4-hydroxy-3-methylbut-2-enyl diphosphate reductase